MKKIVFSLFFALSFLSCYSASYGANSNDDIEAAEANNYDFISKLEDGQILYFKKTSDGTCKVVNKYSRDADIKPFERSYVEGSVEIPSVVTFNGNSLRVTEIDREAFSLNLNLERVKIPESVIIIGSGAFLGCISLWSFDMSSSHISEIKEETFKSCISLRNLDFPETLQEIDYDAFSDCIDLRSLSLPRNLSKINNASFEHCCSIKEVEVNGSEFDLSVLSPTNHLTIRFNSDNKLKIKGCIVARSSKLKLNISDPSLVDYSEILIKTIDGFIPGEYMGEYGDIYPIFDELYVPAGSKDVYQKSDFGKLFRLITED